MTRGRWIIVGVVVVLLVVVGGPFVYIHFIEGKAPANFKLSAAGSGGPDVPLNGTWTVAPGSQAGYRVGETLFGQTSTAVGRTTAVTGRMTVNGSSVESASFSADLRTVKSEQPQRDRQFQGRIMDTARFPTATFTLTKPIDFGTPPANGAVKKVSATGNLTLHGTTKPVTFPISARHSGTTVQALGDIPIVFADWGIPNPTFPGVAETDQRGTLEFLLNFAKGSEPTATTEPTTTTTASPEGEGGPPPGPRTRPTVTPTTLAPLNY